MTASLSSANVLPPGNGAADQYTESYPGPYGNQTLPGAGGKDDDRRPEDVFGRETAEEFTALGSDGEATALLTARTSPLAVSDSGSSSSARGSSPRVIDSAGSAPLGAVARQAFGGDDETGMGWLLPAILIVTTALGAVYVFRNRKSGSAN